jgi:hypothetical protein
MEANDKQLSCLDENRLSARQAARQEFLVRWWYAVALTPFSIVCWFKAASKFNQQSLRCIRCGFVDLGYGDRRLHLLFAFLPEVSTVWLAFRSNTIP